MAGDKRLSMLFPFRTEKKEAKFEVVNRKRSPLGSTTTAQTPLPATHKPAATRSTPTPFDDVAKKVTAQSQPPAPPRTKHAKTPAHQAPSSKLKSQSSIRMADAPLANLNITGSLPPVPDYNSRSFAPPVTIQGRTVSLAKKDAPPRRKPPALAPTSEAAEKSTQQQHTLNSGSSLSVNSHHSPSQKPAKEASPPVPHITVDDIGGVQEKRPIVFREKSRESIVPPKTYAPEPPADEASIPQLPGSFPAVIARTQTPDPSPQPLSKTPLFSPGYIDRPVAPAFTESQTSNRSSYISQGSASEFFDANESIQKSTPNLAHEQTSLFDDEDTPTYPTSQSRDFPYIDRAETGEQPRSIQESYSVESFANSIANSDVSQQSSIPIKPLNFHRKTLSTASNTTMTPDASTQSAHKKQLSLSDEIMRDIDNFRSGGRHENITSGDEDDFISPVTPLKMGTAGQLPLEMPQRSNVLSEPLEDENSGEDEDDTSITPTVQENIADTETPRLKLTNADDEQFDDDLFNDSSDEVLPKQLHNIPQLSAVDALHDPSALQTNSLSRVTSLQPEIDFIQTPVYNYNGLPDIPPPNNHDDELSAESGLPRSSSYHELNRQLTPDSLQSPEPYTDIPTQQQNKDIISDSPSSSSYNKGLAPESPSTYNRDIAVHTPSSRDNASSYSYHQSPERRVFHVVNDGVSLDDSNDVDSSRFEDDFQTRSDSLDQRPRTFHVVNDGDYSDSDSISFDATAGEEINHDYDYQDFSVVHQDQHLSIVPSSMNETSSGDVLSFTARSPKNSEFNIGSPPKMVYSGAGLNYSDIDLNTGGPITPEQSIQPSSDQSSPMHSEYIDSPLPVSAPPVNQPVYDTRIEEKAAPVQNLGQFQGKSRRPPPGGALAVPTRVARSTSVSAPVTNYNTLQEDADEPTPQHHVPETSKYVEMLRLGAGTTNTNVSATTWGLPIGIAEIDHSRFVSSASRAIYKRPTRLIKSDLKHGKIKQRQLALEVGDDEDDEVPSMSGTTERRESNELKRFETTNSLAPSIGSPTMSMSSLSPRKDITANSSTAPSTMLNRSGTLLTDKLPQVSLGVGRAGTVRDGSKAQMTLFIANPDMDSD